MCRVGELRYAEGYRGIQRVYKLPVVSLRPSESGNPIVGRTKCDGCRRKRTNEKWRMLWRATRKGNQGKRQISPSLKQPTIRGFVSFMGSSDGRFDERGLGFCR